MGIRKLIRKKPLRMPPRCGRRLGHAHGVPHFSVTAFGFAMVGIAAILALCSLTISACETARTLTPLLRCGSERPASEGSPRMNGVL